MVGHLLGPALAVAILAAIESLLSARVADAMTGATKTSDTREMVGQGLANMASGFFGGMPATGAIARTAVNVRAGARTRVAAIAHSLVIVAVHPGGGAGRGEDPAGRARRGPGGDRGQDGRPPSGLTAWSAPTPPRPSSSR